MVQQILRVFTPSLVQCPELGFHRDGDAAKHHLIKIDGSDLCRVIDGSNLYTLRFN